MRHDLIFSLLVLLVSTPVIGASVMSMVANRKPDERPVETRNTEASRHVACNAGSASPVQ